MAHRDVNSIFRIFREFLRQRKYVFNLRFKKDIAERSIPAPNLPLGPHHKLSGNYYYSRDARREVEPPLVVAEHSPILKLAPPEASETPKRAIDRTPGPVYNWDSSAPKISYD